MSQTYFKILQQKGEMISSWISFFFVVHISGKNAS